MAQSGGSGGGCLLGTVMLIGIGLLMFTVLTQSGWIPHSYDTPVWIQGDWLVGEFRDCDMRSKMQDTDQDPPEKLPRLFCGEGRMGFVDFQFDTESVRRSAQIPTGNVTADALDRYFHVLPVRYFGRIDRKDKLVISWRCQRRSESLTCKALN